MAFLSKLVFYELPMKERKNKKTKNKKERRSCLKIQLMTQMKISNYTVPELEHFKKLCNFTKDEMDFFEKKSNDMTNDLIAYSMSISNAKVSILARF